MLQEITVQLRFAVLVIANGYVEFGNPLLRHD